MGNIKEARETIRKSFEEDPDFRRAYQDNIAMLLHDRHGITDIEARNKAADDIIKLVFGPDPGEAEEALSHQMEILLQALGEASALFMSQPVLGTEIVMPDQELSVIADRTDKLLQGLSN